MNPNVAVVSVGTTPVLVFAGTGKVRLRSVNGSVVFGTTALNAANSATYLATQHVLEFTAPAEIYAVHPSGSDNVTVENWF